MEIYYFPFEIHVLVLVNSVSFDLACIRKDISSSTKEKNSNYILESFLALQNIHLVNFIE